MRAERIASSVVPWVRLSSEPREKAGEIPYALHVVSGTFVGGGQVGAMELVQQLQASGLTRARLCVLGTPTTYFDPVDPIAIPVYDGRYNDPRMLWRTVRGLRLLVRREAPDILHTHGWDADMVGALAIRGLPIRHVSHVRSLAHWAQSGRLRHRLRVWFTRWVLNSVQTTFLAVSSAAKDDSCGNFGWNAERVKVILNGIDTVKFKPMNTSSPNNELESGRLVLGTAARLSDEKGIDVLLNTVARLPASQVDWELRIAGAGRLLPNLEALAYDLGIAERVQFLGMVDDMIGFYRELDVFVLTSWTEGLPRTVLEAMACGIPVVATDAGGIHEIVRDRLDGFLTRPGDMEALAESIRKLALAPHDRHAKGVFARAQVELKCSLPRLVDEVVVAYHALL